ncbi:transposase [Microbacterium telephonicum]|uniref:Uncharacterized protein n=1 Tax=Microbacterium telephonicum TaxID=1714841 RepID=A0A498CKU4_9MICO|nr:transposase [Microbacterium telephonicum]RLK52608.1 hypothetical protein C7474_0559 [Microbacterium telephonicum]
MAPDAPGALDDIVVELYAVPPAEFTAARTARAAESDADLAAEIRSIRKPVVAAWAVDLLAREGMLGDAIALAADLREAQEGLDAAELSRLGRQRRQLVAALAGQAVSLADERGVAVSAAARTDIEQTLNAAMIDADAAAAVLSGRLAKPISATGLGDVDLTDALAGSVPAGAAPAPPPDDLAERRARKVAEKVVREAEREAEGAERERARADARRDREQARLDDVRERVDALRRDLERAEADASDAEERLADAARAAKAAATAARAATKKAAAARAALD